MMLTYVKLTSVVGNRNKLLEKNVALERTKHGVLTRSGNDAGEEFGTFFDFVPAVYRGILLYLSYSLHPPNSEQLLPGQKI